MPDDTRPDALEAAERPDRPFYATGVLLDAEDFLDEQTYHRGRLARALAWLHGSGTVAGLAVGAPQPMPAGGTDFELAVQPGLALDRFGRLIEVPRPWCIRINRWYAALADAANAQGRAALANALRGDRVTVDLYVVFETCERGKTPSFAEGAVDATDAFTVHRLRDGFRFLLAPRDLDPDDPATLPGARFPAFSGGATPEQRVLELKQNLLNGWGPALARPGDRAFPAAGEPQLAYSREHARVLPPAAAGEAGEPLSPAAVFLARLRIPATAGAGDAAPTPDFAAMTADDVDNLSRAFVFPTDALARALGLVPDA
jgi:hypothetical protein